MHVLLKIRECKVSCGYFIIINITQSINHVSKEDVNCKKCRLWFFMNAECSASTALCWISKHTSLAFQPSSHLSHKQLIDAGSFVRPIMFSYDVTYRTSSTYNYNHYWQSFEYIPSCNLKSLSYNNDITSYHSKWWFFAIITSVLTIYLPNFISRRYSFSKNSSL